MAREKSKILIIEDEDEIRELVGYHLRKENYEVLSAADGEGGLEIARTHTPDLILLDLMLPGIDGLQVCQRLKIDDRLRNVPVLILTAKSEESDQVIGLGLGADDYVTKPFSPRVLMARVKAALRRQVTNLPPEGDTPASLRRGPFAIHPGRHEVRIDDREVRLTPIEFRILYCLARRPGWVFTRSKIIENALGEDVLITERTVDVHVVSLRRKLGETADYIETVRGVGYRFRD